MSNFRKCGTFDLSGFLEPHSNTSLSYFSGNENKVWSGVGEVTRWDERVWREKGWMESPQGTPRREMREMPEVKYVDRWLWFNRGARQREDEQQCIYAFVWGKTFWGSSMKKRWFFLWYFGTFRNFEKEAIERPFRKYYQTEKRLENKGR